MSNFSSREITPSERSKEIQTNFEPQTYSETSIIGSASTKTKKRPPPEPPRIDIGQAGDPQPTAHNKPFSFSSGDDEPDTNSDVELRKECSEVLSRRFKVGLTPGYPIQYIHIPKAGGTTIQESIIPWATKRGYKTYLHNGDHDGSWKCPGAVDRGILMGHRGFGFCEKMLKNYGENALYLVALREPVSRFRSLFDYFMDNDYSFFSSYHDMWKGRNLSDLIIDADRLLGLNLPSSDPRLRSPKRFLELARQQTNFMCGWDCVSLKSNLTISEKFDRAAENLRRTQVVVVMEHLDDMIDQLRFQTNLVPLEVRRFPMENTHKGKKSILTPEAAVIVAKWTRRDTQLYEIAKTFHAQLTDDARSCLASAVKSKPRP